MHSPLRRRLRLLTAAFIANGLLAGTAAAANFTWLTDTSLVGRLAIDNFLDNGDDVVGFGFNTIGAASQSSIVSGAVGFFQGTHTAQSSSIFGLQDQLQFGDNVFESINLTGRSRFDQPFSQSLAGPGPGPSHITINHDQSYTTSVVVTDTQFGGLMQVTGQGHYLLNSQNANTLYSGDLRGHFNFITSLLPADWQFVAQESQTWTVLTGFQAGLTGSTTATFYSQDSSATPRDLPVISLLGAPWVTTGYAALNAARNEAQIGSPPPPSAPGNLTGTATLSSVNGAVSATLDGLTIGGGSPNGGAGTVTVDGRGFGGTANLHWGKTLVINNNGALNVSDGGIATGAGDGGVIQSRGAIHVSGNNAVMNFSCGTGSPGCESNGVTNALLFLAGGSDTTIDAGGLMIVDGTSTASNSGVEIRGADRLGFNAAPAVLNVDGLGSELLLRNGTLATGNAVAVEEGATVNVTNGGKLVIQQAFVGGSGVFIDTAGAGPGMARVKVDGANSLIDGDQNIFIGTHPFSDPGKSELVVSNGGLVKADHILIGPGGTVKGNEGSLKSPLVENHGTIEPGASPGTLTIDGDLVQAADGKLVIEIGGNTAGSLYDVLNVTGKLSLGGTLEIVLINGFTPAPNDIFNFLTFDSFDGSFANVIAPIFSNNQTLHLNFGPNGITAANAVPVPAAVWLLGAALGGLGFYRRRV